MKETGILFENLTETVAHLRSEQGCPWDRKQTLRDFKRYLIEEVYELAGAIDDSETEAITEEIGDVLLNLLLICEAMRQDGKGGIDSVLTGITAKVIGRHPHVFGDDKASSAEEAFASWHRSKKEKENKSLFEGIPSSAPALNLAYLISRRAAKLGFGFESTAEVMTKIEEEISELKHEVKTGDNTRIEEESGDAMIAIVNLCLVAGIDPDEALKGTCDRFRKRLTFIESELDRQGVPFMKAPRERLEELWEASKGIVN